jgi:hypothetical protein
VTGPESTRHLNGRHLQLRSQLAQPDTVSDPRAQELLGRSQPRRRAIDPAGISFPADGGEKLERDPFGRQRRRRVRGAKLSGEPPSQPSDAAPAKLLDPPEGNPVRRTPSLHDHDPRPVRPEAGAVPGAGGHCQRRPSSEGHPVAEGLHHRAVDDDGEVREIRLEFGLHVPGRERKLSDGEAIQFRGADDDSVLADDGGEAHTD